MSTDSRRDRRGGDSDRGSRREAARRRKRRAFLGAFAIVVGALLVIGLGGAALTTAQGPRATSVQVDPDAAASASGSRMIITTSQSLQTVDPSQVTITPAADFTVDTSGRSVGVRFALPLWDDTDYTVRIDGVEGVGGGPTATIEESFSTPPLDVYVLRRGIGSDAIFRSDLAGTDAVPVYEHEHIEDFRETANHLVIVSENDDGNSVVIVTDLDGGSERELPLPGDGFVTNLQSADRGDLIGYTFTDANVGTTGALESTLFTASLADAKADAKPQKLTITGADPRVDDWRFVPGTDTVLMLTFDGLLSLVSASGGDPVALGNAITIDGIARGSTEAIVQRPSGLVAIDLSTADERALPATDPSLGEVQTVTTLQGGEDDTLRVLSQVDGFTVQGTTVDVVDDQGAARSVFEVDPADTLLQTCVSPSGRYAAILVAPDIVNNSYDGYQLPMPEKLETHIVELDDGTETVALSGFDLSWCQVPPRP